MDSTTRPIVTQQIEIVDNHGVPRLVLSAKSGSPMIQLLQPDGAAGVEVSLDANGRPAIKLASPDPSGLSAALEVDDKGAHVKFDRPGGASSYFFLNNAGGSGVVFLDTKGVRRLNLLVGSDGVATIERFDLEGKPIS
jgi:hypothetical protein